MKKILRLSLLLICAISLTACGSGLTRTGQFPLSDAVYTNDKISLAAYRGLKAEKKVYEVTQDAVDSQVHDLLSSYADYQPVSRASQSSDTVTASYTATVDGEVVDEDDGFDFVLGEETFGSDFDQRLTGVTSGQKLDFTIAYPEDSEQADWAGKSVDFSVNVTSVKEEVLPEITDDFILTNMGYETYDAFVAATRAELEEEYAQESDTELQEDLVNQVVDSSRVLSYSKEDYDNAHDKVVGEYQSYADMFGMELSDIYESFDLTEDDIEAEVLHQLYQSLAISAIAENENLTISQDELQAGAEEYATLNDYDSGEELLEAFGEDTIRSQLIEDKVLKLLEDTAELTDVSAVYEE